MNILELSEQEIVRRNNLQQLKDMGIEPYPAAEYPVTAWSTDIIANFTDLPVIGKDEQGNDVRETATADNSPVVSIAGRMMSRRIMGKAGPVGAALAAVRPVTDDFLLAMLARGMIDQARHAQGEILHPS